MSAMAPSGAEQVEQENRERLEAVSRVKEYLAAEQIKISEKLEALQKGENPENRVTVTRDLRIEPPQSRYIERDRKFVEEVSRQNYGTADTARVEAEESLKEGFQFELLKTAIMHKYAGKQFITLRSSRYDDIANGVDNVLVDITTGEPICAFDEVATEKITGSKRYDEKIDEIVRSNLGLYDGVEQKRSAREGFGPGARLKYGLRIRDNNLECRPMNNLPLFLLPIDRERLKGGLENFGTEEGDIYLKMLYRYFLLTMNRQIGQMASDEFKKEFTALPPEMQQRISYFKSFLDQEIMGEVENN